MCTELHLWITLFNSILVTGRLFNVLGYFD